MRPRTHRLHSNLILVCLIALGFLDLRSSAAGAEGTRPQLIERPTFKLLLHAEPSHLSLTTSDDQSIKRCRPHVTWRYLGESAWRQDLCSPLVGLKTEKHRLSFETKAGPLRASITVEPQVPDAWEFSGLLTNDGDKPIELARFHYLHGTIDKKYGLLKEFGRLIRHGEHTKPERAFLEEFWASMSVRWPRLAEPIHDAADWAVTIDVGALLTAWNEPGWVCGCIGPGTAFGEVGLQTMPDEPTFYMGILLDNIVIDPGEARALEHAIVHYGDLQDGLHFWAEQCARLHPKARVPAPMVGYCSWYQVGASVEPKHIIRAAEEFASWPIPPGGRLIQIDDGFQRLPADWAPNERFATTWKDLPRAIKKTGSVPGMWLAPTMAHQTSLLVKEHPDWVQRLPNGQPAVSFSNWQSDAACGRIRNTFPLETDRPDVRAWISDLFKGFVGEGWEYIKIDFVYPVCTARLAYDRKRTQFQTLRDCFAVFREACGPKTLINACIGEPGRYALGYADYARLGGDISSNWDSVTGELRALLMRFCTNGQWWIGDTDTFYMRRENSKLTPEESYLQTGSIGLTGGLFLTSDYPSQWSAEAKEAVREFWNERGPRVPADQYVLFTADGTPLAYRVSYTGAKELAPQHQVGLYNWANEARLIRVALNDVGLNPDIRWRLTASRHAPSVRLVDNCLIVDNQPPHSLRIARLAAE